jgi:hypothetical protein
MILLPETSSINHETPMAIEQAPETIESHVVVVEAVGLEDGSENMNGDGVVRVSSDVDGLPQRRPPQ